MSGNLSWYHCGQCGALFQSAPRGEAPGRCAECGRDPVPPEVEESRPDTLLAAAVAAGADAEAVEASRRQRKARPRREMSGVVTFALGWLVFLLILVGAVTWFRQGTVREQDGGEVAEVPQIDVSGTRLIQDEYLDCAKAVTEFLATPAPELRARYVMNPGETLGRMVQLHQESPILTSDESPNYLHFGVIETPKGRALEGVWEVDGVKKVEAVFFEDKTGDEEGEWKIDWSNLARYSTHSWNLFLAGIGDDEGEFRVLARRRGGADGDRSSVLLVGPRVGYPELAGAQSPEIEVDPDSRIGRILDKAFEMRANDEMVFGAEAGRYDPPGMIRLRARVRREGDVDRTYVLRDIIACHWLEIDELGLPE